MSKVLGDNARIDNVRSRIISELNAARLPIYVLEYIVGEIYTDLKSQRVTQVKKEQEEYLKEAVKPVKGEVLPPKKGSDSA